MSCAGGGAQRSATDTTTTDASRDKPSSTRRELSRIDQASLLKRIFKLDVLACGRCGGRMRVIAVLERQPVIEKILSHLDLPRVPLPTSLARGQRAVDFFAA